MQYFDANHTTINHNFLFGNANMGYMNNLAKGYLVHSSGTSTNDTYSGFQFSSGRHTVVDAGGTSDTLTISEDINNIRMYFNITNEGSVLGSDLYFVNSTEFQNFMKGNEVNGYLNIKTGIGAGEIENVQDGTYSLNYSSLTSAADGSLVAEVSAWLSQKGYASADAVISGNSDADKQTLYSFYNNHTNFANNGQNLYWGQA